MVTGVPIGPEVEDRLAIIGTIVKFTALLAPPFAVTTTRPLAAPLGTGAVIEVPLQLVGADRMPLNVTVPDPCGLPKRLPVIVTGVPIVPEAGNKLLMAGGFAPVPDRLAV